MLTQTDERYSFDGRLDYRLTDHLTVYAKGTIANRQVHDQNRSRTPVSMFNQNLAGTFVDSAAPDYPRIRSVSPNAPAGYYVYDQAYGLNNVGNNATLGNVLNVVPTSIKVDENHNVTQMTLTNNSVGIDQIENHIDTKTKYAQIGAEYEDDHFEGTLWAGLTRASTSRGDMRTSRTYAYGDATLTLQPNGLWDIALPSTHDETNPPTFVQLTAPPCARAGTNPATCTGQAAVAAGPNGPATPAYLVSQMPLTTPNFSIQYTPALGVSTDKEAKFDLGYKTNGDIPFITRIKVGANYRNQDIKRWNNGGYTVSPATCKTGTSCTFGSADYVPAVIVPTAILRGSYRACEPTPGSSARGGLSCYYGFVPSTNPANVRSGVDTLTPDQLRSLFEQTLEAPDSAYFGDLPNRGNPPPARQGHRTDELFSQLGASQFMNFDCLKTCMGSDGKMYDQPVTRANETIKDVYGMVDFEQQLPLGLLFNGNAGGRGVCRNVKASGLQTVRVVRVTPSFDPNNPNAAAGFVNYDYSAPVTINSSTSDWLPSVNLNLWAFHESVVLRAYGGKTLAWPDMNKLIPSGTCTAFEEREALDPAPDDTAGCPSGRVGNPGLKPFTAWNYNLSLEWYPNRDTLLSVTYGKLDVKVGNPINVTVLEKPFAGSTQTDPVSGQPLADVEFLVPTYGNGPGYKRDIWEFQAKTAFTFLPWFLRHTGADLNFSILASSVTSGQQDPLTGDTMLPPDESKYYANASLWYDDGKLNLRVAYQRRSSRFSCITPCGGNSVDINYPGEQWTNVRLVAPGYNPGVPRFTDESTFIDAKASYNINRNFQVYLEARNIGREAQTISTGGYTDFADGTPKIMRLQYGGGRRQGGGGHPGGRL